MADAAEHVESAIVEATKARQALARSTQRQVRSAEEIDRIKAVAFAWLKSHRPVVEHVGGLDLSEVDAAYHAMLDATARFASRTTYLTSLKLAKNALVELRKPVTLSVANATFAASISDQNRHRISPLSRLTSQWRQFSIAGGRKFNSALVRGLTSQPL